MVSIVTEGNRTWSPYIRDWVCSKSRRILSAPRKAVPRLEARVSRVTFSKTFVNQIYRHMLDYY